MSEHPANGAAGQTAAGQNAAPRLSIVSQYVKDLSFENPSAPGSPAAQGRPDIQVRVDVQAKKLEDGKHEVSLKLDVEAKSGEETIFVAELLYGGVFSYSGIPDDKLHALVMIECPRLLFPFARRIIADVTRDGGFPPLMVDPIDFVQLYARRLQAAQQAQQAAAKESADAS